MDYELKRRGDYRPHVELAMAVKVEPGCPEVLLPKKNADTPIFLIKTLMLYR